MYRYKDLLVRSGAVGALTIVTLGLAACGGGGGGGGDGGDGGGDTATPALTISDAQLQEGDSGTATMAFTATLAPTAGGKVNVDYATNDGTAEAGTDYDAISGTLEFSGGQSQRTIEVPVRGDTAIEPNETFELTLSNVSSNAVIGDATAVGTIIADDRQPLNDTGVTTFGAGSSNTLTREPTNYPGQDASYGRDVTAGGFDFVSEGACVRDRTTGLVWEVKTSTGYRAASNTYTWYNADTSSNGGNAGAVGTTGTCTLGGSMTSCNTEQYVAAVNTAQLCGHSDWRLPTREELRSIVDYGDSTAPMIDPAFGDTAAGRYWAIETEADVPANAHGVYFTGGHDNDEPKTEADYVRLVRDPQ